MGEVQSARQLLEAAEGVCRAMREHARACAEEDDLSVTIGAGEALVRAVLEYERQLAVVGRWSNPIRHLGRLPQFDEDNHDHLLDDGSEAIVRVSAEYLLGVANGVGLRNLVEGRGGDRPSSLEQAVRFLFEADSWDLGQYPRGYINPREVTVEISIEDGEEYGGH